MTRISDPSVTRLTESTLQPTDLIPIGRSGSTPRARAVSIQELREHNQQVSDLRYLRQLDDVVITRYIDNRAVTGAKIALNTIATNNIEDGAVTAAKLGRDVNLGGGGISQTDGDNRWRRLSVLIVNNDFDDNTISGGRLLDNSVTLAKLAADARPSGGGGAAFSISALNQGSIAAADQFAFSDVSDSNNQKRASLQVLSNFIFEDSRFTSLSSGGGDATDVDLSETDLFLISDKTLNVRQGVVSSDIALGLGALTIPDITASTGDEAPTNSSVVAFSRNDPTLSTPTPRTGNAINITTAGSYSGGGVIRIQRDATSYEGNDRAAIKTFFVMTRSNGDRTLLSSTEQYVRGALVETTPPAADATIGRFVGTYEFIGNLTFPPTEMAVGDQLNIIVEVEDESSRTSGDRFRILTSTTPSDIFEHNFFRLTRIKSPGSSSSGGGVGGASDQALLTSYVDLPTASNQSVNATLSNPITISGGGHLEIDMINGTTEHTFSIPIRKITALNGTSDALNARSTNTLDLALSQAGDAKWAFAAAGFNLSGYTNININFSSSTGSSTTFDTLTGFTTSASNLPTGSTWRINEVHLVR